jgi:hypothetical protein
MIQYNDPSEKTQIKLLLIFKELGISKLLRKAGITKAQGHSPLSVFKFLFLLVFQGKSLYRFLDSERSSQAFSKNTYYRFLNNCTYNWRRFLSLLSVKVISRISKLTRPERVKSFVLDDSLVPRERSKKVELLARLFDHTSCKFQKGFTMLTLGWSDGYSFIPVDFAMLSSANKKNRLHEVSDSVDKRTNGYKRRKEAVQKKTTVAISLIQNALKAGVEADYVLMDSWFTHEPFIKAILKEGLDVIGMVKQLKQKYEYNNCWYTLKELKKFIPTDKCSNVLGSINVKTKNGIKVNLVYVKNRNKKNNWLVVLSTDLTISADEIIRIYGNRWSIEVFFKSIKSFMKLGKEFQSRNYDAMISHTTIVYTRYIFLEWLRREEKDEKTFGELFFMYSDDVRDMDTKTALQNLMGLFVEHLNGTKSATKDKTKLQLQYWIADQATFIKALFMNLCWES